MMNKSHLLICRGPVTDISGTARGRSHPSQITWHLLGGILSRVRNAARPRKPNGQRTSGVRSPAKKEVPDLRSNTRTGYKLVSTTETQILPAENGSSVRDNSLGPYNDEGSTLSSLNRLISTDPLHKSTSPGTRPSARPPVSWVGERAQINTTAEEGTLVG